LALKFINTNNQGATVKFLSSQNFTVGAPVCYKQIGFGSYILSGSTGNKTATISNQLSSGVSEGSRYLYFNFSDETIPYANYSSTISSSGTNIVVNGINTSSNIVSGTVNFYDFELAISNSGENFAQYLINKKATGTLNSYTAIKIGEFSNTLSNWNSLKDYTENYSGLIPGASYYLSSLTKGKIVNYKTDVKLFTAISRTKVFINLLYSDSELITNQNIIRETFTGTGSQNIYTLSQVPNSIDSTTVFINGLFQIPGIGNAYTLNNNIITFDGYPPLGSKITIQYLKQYTQTSYDLYMDRKTYLLAINSEISLFSIFNNTQDSGQYRFFDIINPTISGIISLKNNGLAEPLVRVDTNSDDVTIVSNTSNKLNVYLKVDNYLYFQNKTTNNLNLRIYKET
jgi:hypothetical protein